MRTVDLERIRLRADVVVVGSGGAGLCAAAAARRAGAEVILVTKGKLGLANATAYAGGGFTVSPPPVGKGTGDGHLPVSEPFEPGRLTPEEHFRFSLEAGRGLNDPELLRRMCERGPQVLAELEQDFAARRFWLNSSRTSR